MCDSWNFLFSEIFDAGDHPELSKHIRTSEQVIEDSEKHNWCWSFFFPDT